MEYKDINLKKGKSTARDFVESEFGPEGLEEYIGRVNSLFENDVNSRTKRKYLLMRSSEIPDDFLNRDLSNSQYIAKKATEILESYVKTVMPTTGSITARLREDWQLVNVMKEINLPKYREVGLTYKEDRGESGEVEKIEDWSKRDDHRHHAMDAITIAFTKLSHIQYLNNLNARSDKSSSVYGIEKYETILNANGKRIFTPRCRSMNYAQSSQSIKFRLSLRKSEKQGGNEECKQNQKEEWIQYCNRAYAKRPNT